MKKFCLLLMFLFAFCFHSVNAVDLNEYRHFITAVHSIDKVINNKPLKFTHIFLNDGTEWLLHSEDKDLEENLEIFIKPFKHKYDSPMEEFVFHYLDKEGNEKEATVFLIPGAAKKYLPTITEFKTVLVKKGWLSNEYDYFVKLSDGSSWKVSDFLSIDEWEIGNAIVISAEDSKYEKWIVTNYDLYDYTPVLDKDGKYTIWYSYFEVDAPDVQ